MKCVDVMTKTVKSVPASATARQAALIMKNANVGILPVNDDKTKEILGVVTDRDLCLGVVANGKDSGEARVSEFMSSRVIFCHPDDDIHDAEMLMKTYQVRRIAVVDRNEMCVGIISQADIAVKITEPREVYDTVREISLPKMMAI